MIKFLLNNIEYEFNYDGLKVFWLNNTGHICASFINNLNESKCNWSVNDEHLNLNNTIVINEYSHLCDLLNISKSNILIKSLVQHLDLSNLLNQEKINELQKWFNDQTIDNYVSLNLDILKIISTIFDINEYQTINKEIFLKILNIFKSSPKKLTFVISNISWLDINDLKDYIGIYNFIIFSNDFRSNIHSINRIEDYLIIENSDNKLVEILDINRLMNYIEEQLKIPFNLDDFQNWISYKDKKNEWKIIEILKKFNFDVL